MVGGRTSAYVAELQPSRSQPRPEHRTKATEEASEGETDRDLTPLEDEEVAPVKDSRKRKVRRCLHQYSHNARLIRFQGRSLKLH